MHFALGRLKGFRYGYVTVITRYSHYDTLGVSKNATHERIKAKYYELSKKYHPDLNESEESAEKFRAVAEAYEVLGNVNERRTYDKLIQGRGMGPGVVNKQDHVTVSGDYSQHLREKFHYSQRSSAVSRPRYRKRTQEQHFRQQMRMSQRTSEGNVEGLIVLSVIFIILSVFSGMSRH